MRFTYFACYKKLQKVCVLMNYICDNNFQIKEKKKGAKKLKIKQRKGNADLIVIHFMFTFL